MRKSFYGWMFVAVTATACGAPDQSSEESRTESPRQQQLAGSDATAPVSQAFSIPGPDENGEHHGDVTVMIRATDNSSGVEAIYWEMSGAVSKSGQTQGAQAWLPLINQMGTTTITFYAKDKAGNYEAPQTLVIKITPTPPPEECTPINLSDFNLFVLGDYSGGVDVLGKVAAGGNVTMKYFAVGSGLQGDDRENTLVAGGNLNISHGSVHGDAFYGLSTTADQTVSFHQGTLSQGEPIDFASRGEELFAASESLASKEVTGTARFETWGGIFLEGSEEELNVFEVPASAFSNARYFSINVPQGSMALVNVIGETASFSNFGNGYTGVDATGVLFNFPFTTRITASSYGFFGTVLAPQAHVTFNNGSWDGGIYAASFTGNAEGHIAPLRDIDADCTPPQYQY